MPIETLIDRDLGIVIQRVTVELLADEVVAAQRCLYADRDHDPATPVLWDAREAVVSNTAFDEMAKMARKAEQFYERMAGGRTAILVRNLADFGMGRMYQSLADGMPRELQVFADYELAIAWLREGAGQS